MNGQYFFASAAVASVLAFTTPAHAQLLGGGLSGAVGSTLSGGLGGINGVGGMTSVATGTVRDVNSIGRATTQHVHDTVSATADATDRAAANVDKQLESTRSAADATAHATTSATSSAASNVDTKAARPKLDQPKAPVSPSKPAEPVKPVTTEPTRMPGVDASVQGSASAQSNASVAR